MKRKICPCNMIAQLMLDGNPISPEAIREAFAEDKRMTKVLYRLAVYISDLRKQGGIVVPIKEGRKVLTFTLKNADLFDLDGFYTGVSRSLVAQDVKLSEPSETPTEPSVETVETVSEVPVETMVVEVPQDQTVTV